MIRRLVGPPPAAAAADVTMPNELLPTVSFGGLKNCVLKTAY
jgi:hypothetical protein